jgi:hypothetical protein
VLEDMQAVFVTNVLNDMSDYFILVAGPSVMVYTRYLHKNQQVHQNYHFIVMLSQMLLHVSAHQRHRQGAYTILTSYLSMYITERKM